MKSKLRKPLPFNSYGNFKYKVERKYYSLFFNNNLRNNQNYIYGNNIYRKLKLYFSDNHIWKSNIKVIDNKILLSHKSKHAFSSIYLLFIGIILYIYSGIIGKFFGFIIILLGFLYLFAILHTYFYDTLSDYIVVKDKDKFIVLKK